MIESMTKLSHKSEWETPKEVFEYIENNYLKGKFTIDLCADEKNTKCKLFIDEKTDLFRTFYSCPSYFENETCFMNPPYAKKSKDKLYSIEDFIHCACRIRDTTNSTVAVLVFANISSTKYFQQYVGETETDRYYNDVELHFLPKRIRFLENGKPVGTPAFSSMVIIFRSRTND